MGSSSSASNQKDAALFSLWIFTSSTHRVKVCDVLPSTMGFVWKQGTLKCEGWPFDQCWSMLTSIFPYFIYQNSCYYSNWSVAATRRICGLRHGNLSASHTSWRTKRHGPVDLYSNNDHFQSHGGCPPNHPVVMDDHDLEIETYGSVSKPSNPGEHQNSW